MKADFDLLFDACLQKLQEGYSLEECLAECPEYAEELRPLLETALNVSQLPRFEVRQDAFDAGRQRMLRALHAQNALEIEKPAEKSTEKSALSPGWFSRSVEQIPTFIHAKFAAIFARKGPGNRKLALSLALSLTVVLIGLIATVGNASAASLPGDALYPVKRARENAMLLFTFDEARVQLEERFLQERHEEVQMLTKLKRSAEFEFVADVETIAPQQWTVGGFVLVINSNTFLDEDLAVGKTVRVRVQVGVDGKLFALGVREARPIGKTGHTKTPQVTQTPVPSVSKSRTPTPKIPQCTPLPCLGGELVCSDGDCLGGCGMVCEEDTLTPTSTPSLRPVCTRVPCSNGKLACLEGDCPGGCGMVCEENTPTPTPSYTPITPFVPVCTAVSCSNGELVCPTGNCLGGCGLVCEESGPTPMPICTPVPCSGGKMVCLNGDCPGGCGMVCTTDVPTDLPTDVPTIPPTIPTSPIPTTEMPYPSPSSTPTPEPTPTWMSPTPEPTSTWASPTPTPPPPVPATFTPTLTPPPPPDLDTFTPTRTPSNTPFAFKSNTPILGGD